MTTLIWFSELLVWTPKPNKATNDLYEGISKQMTYEHFKKWDELDR